MKRLLLLIALTAASLSTWGQGFWAPGACWTFNSVWTPYMERYTYVSDTVIDGMDVQVCLYEQCATDLGGAWDCTSFNSPYYEFTTLQQNIVLYQLYPFTSTWDTLYKLGVPGDRWWPRYADQSCPPYGMMEIQDTGHVTIDGISLRSWDVAMLDPNGTAMPENGAPGADTMSIIERVGGRPRRYCPLNCDPDIQVDCGWLQMTHFSDHGISIPAGTNCDISTSSASHQKLEQTAFIHPNPGTDQLRISGLSDLGARIEVHDALGRSVAERSFMRSEEFIGTADWEPGAYFITIGNPNGARQVLRWVKQ